MHRPYQFLIILSSTVKLIECLAPSHVVNQRLPKLHDSQFQLLAAEEESSDAGPLSARPRLKSSIREEIRYIAGRRALLIHPPKLATSDAIPKYPPLVILGGMAQSIASWEFHLPGLSQHRSVLVYEALGQGPPPPHEVCSIDVGDGSKREVTLDQYYDDVSLERHGRDFWEVVEEAFFSPDSYYFNNYAPNNIDVIDVAGFSFGGRVAMAAATLKPNRIRRLYLTGVAAERDPLANVILASWKEILGVNNNGDQSSEDIENEYDRELQSYYDEECDPEIHASRCTGRLRSFAWSVILHTYSEQFLAQAGPNKVQTWVDGVCRYNTEEGLRAILMQTHGHFLNESGDGDATDLWAPASMASRIYASKAIDQCKIVVGSQDKMSSPTQALRLASILGLSKEQESDEAEGKASDIICSYKIVEGCGHAVPMEAMRQWREDVLAFLN